MGTGFWLPSLVWGEKHTPEISLCCASTHGNTLVGPITSAGQPACCDRAPLPGSWALTLGGNSHPTGSSFIFLMKALKLTLHRMIWVEPRKDQQEGNLPTAPSNASQSRSTPPCKQQTTKGSLAHCAPPVELVGESTVCVSYSRNCSYLSPSKLLKEERKEGRKSSLGIYCVSHT